MRIFARGGLVVMFVGRLVVADSLTIIPRGDMTLAGLQISRQTLRDLREKPATEALRIRREVGDAEWGAANGP